MKTSLLSFFFLLMTISLMAQDPTEAAPTPTVEEENVISLFSNAYTDVAVDTWRTDWSAATLTDIQINGDDVKKYEALDFVGIETVGANLVDASGMTYFNFDFWTPDMTTVRVKLVDFGADGAFDGGDDTEHEIVYENIAQGEWVTNNIALTDFTNLTSTDNIAQLIFSGLPAGGGTLYVDNVYFSTELTNVSSFEESNVTMFPNPVQNDFTIRSEERIETIQIFDVVGKLMLEDRGIDYQSSWNIADFPTGVYVVKATVNGKTVVGRLLKN